MIFSYFQDLLHLDLLPSHQQLFSSPYYPTSSYHNTQYMVSHPISPFDTYSSPILPHPPTLHNTLSKGSPNTHGLPTPPPSNTQDAQDQIYSQLQLPSASNHGSMKKKKVSTAVESRGPSNNHASASSSSISSSPNYRETEYYDKDVKVWAVEYGPEVFTIRKKTVKVWHYLKAVNCSYQKINIRYHKTKISR